MANWCKVFIRKFVACLRAASLTKQFGRNTHFYNVEHETRVAIKGTTCQRLLGHP